MRRGKQQPPSMAAELENVLYAYEWARERVYRRRGVRKEHVALLRRAVSGGQASLAGFRKDTGMHKSTLTRAAQFLAAKSRKWVRLLPKQPDNRKLQYLAATAAGVAILEAVDREVESEFFSGLDNSLGSPKYLAFEEAVRSLNRLVRSKATDQQFLFSPSKYGLDK